MLGLYTLQLDSDFLARDDVGAYLVQVSLGSVWFYKAVPPR